MMESAINDANCQIVEVQRGTTLPHTNLSRAVLGSYRVICPLGAHDAGLGEIRRMGLLMTLELGPYMRLAIVTTNLPLIPNERQHDMTMIDFCIRCKKNAQTFVPIHIRTTPCTISFALA